MLLMTTFVSLSPNRAQLLLSKLFFRCVLLAVKSRQGNQTHTQDAQRDKNGGDMHMAVIAATLTARLHGDAQWRDWTRACP